jgi:hypothetical protein
LAEWHLEFDTSFNQHDVKANINILHQNNIIFVGARNARATVQWAGVAMGSAMFAIALSAASLFGWYLLVRMTGAEFARSFAVCFALSVGGAAAAVSTVITGSFRRPLRDLPLLD